jgi:putative Ig domain-containing protein
MASTVRAYIAFFSVTFAAAILGGCNDGTSGSNGDPVNASSAPGAVANGALSISGSPASSVVAGSSYSFRPTAGSASGAALTFAIENQPGWAKFDPATGTLTGTPTTSYVGSSAQIVITVGDGSATAALPAFAIEVTQIKAGVAALSWMAPTAVTGAELAGYHIYYGESSTQLTQVVDISDPGSTSFAVDKLASGTWYFAIKSYTSSDVESSLSAVVAVTI